MILVIIRMAGNLAKQIRMITWLFQYRIVILEENKTMLRVSLSKVRFLMFLLVCLFLVDQIKLSSAERNFQDIDVFEIHKIRPRVYPLSVDYFKKYELDKLNNFFIDKTDSIDAKENLDIILEQLILDYKNKVPFNDDAVKVKRLMLALMTIKGQDDECRYGHKILKTVLDATHSRYRLLVKGGAMKRVDKIVKFYIDEHTNDCTSTYLKNFDTISKNLDGLMEGRVNLFLRDTIELLTSGELRKIMGDNHKERLQFITEQRIGISFDMTSESIYNIMQELAKDDPNKKFLDISENERTGEFSIVKNKFGRLFDKYVAQPCDYYRKQLSQDVFAPVIFDNMFTRIETNRVDFYEAWLKYDLCYFSGQNTETTLERVLEYARNKQYSKQ